MHKLTERQREVLDYIRSSISGRGYPPTLREIGSFMGIRSTNGVNDHLKALQKKGFLTRDDMKSRALRPAEMAIPVARAQPRNDGETLEIPVLGRVAAGVPLLAEEHLVDTMRIDRALVRGGGEIFGLRVRGDSMIEAGILHGDTVFVRKQSAADRGDIVVALIGEEATVKHYYPERDYVRFQPANSQVAPIMVRARDFKPTMLLGVVVGVYRRL